MSTAHRPTWDPAQAKDVKGGSRQFSVRDMAAHTKLKFRFVIYFIHTPFGTASD
jgi:protein CWC15